MVSHPETLGQCCKDPLIASWSCSKQRLENEVAGEGAEIGEPSDSNSRRKEDSIISTIHAARSAQHRERSQQYGSTFVCLMILERWLELGIRPDKDLVNSMCSIFCANSRHGARSEKGTKDRPFRGEDLSKLLQSLCENPNDDLKGIKTLVNDTRRYLWSKALDASSDDHLVVAPSKIPNAQQGLFAATNLPGNSICCYYSGDIHSTHSSQSKSMLPDASYLLRIGNISRLPWWYPSLCPDKHTNDGSNQEISNNSSNSACTSLRGCWDQMMCEVSTTAEFYVDPTNVSIKARYINDCLQDHLYNVKFVLDPCGERAAVVTLREIQAGEELYVSYGLAYWDSMEASTSIVPRRLET